MSVRRALPGAFAGTLVVAGGTAANRFAGLPLSTVASSPRAIDDGRLWLLVTSGLLASDPWLPSLLGFGLTLFAALCVLPAVRVAMVAAAGQVLATALVYGTIAAVHRVAPPAFAGVADEVDYGVSTMIAAWIGAIACVAWRRGDGGRRRAAVVGGCLLCLAVGLTFRPRLDALDSEHLVAFALGAAVALPAPRAARLLRPLLLLVQRPG